jgi:hypothetical protein
VVSRAGTLVATQAMDFSEDLAYYTKGGFLSENCPFQ